MYFRDLRLLPSIFFQDYINYNIFNFLQDHLLNLSEVGIGCIMNSYDISSQQ